ncbi:organic cation transporter protein-like [Homalodisca vitripennis]|uniref:organic cation transporter protein-like n=1 Tax=Homalodisca vitripennis TaxID=197043 RepID=UPI001EEB69DB|nr:organic cation transporter protein-like [Homalodisca vitripennis]XP_046670849.1 organic cation transporter protein-like [Homalodisca vitripennis]
MGQNDAQWGRYHAGASVLMALLKMPAAWYQLSLLFLSPNINFRCAIPSNESRPISNLSRSSWDDSCSYRDQGGTPHSCDLWQYDTSELSNTVNMMWNLVCDRELLATWAQFSFMCGVFSGNVIGGFLADRVGRKPVLVFAVLLQPLMSAVVAVVPWFSLFLLFRFLLGLALGGTIVISFLLGGELGAGPWRPAITILHQVPFGMGQTLLALAAYFLRDWRELQMALSVFCLIFLPYCWLVEESPKWLMATGQQKRAERVMEVIRRRNGVPQAADTEMLPMTEKNKVQIVKADNEKLNNNGGVGFCDLFRTPRLRHYTLAVWLMWYCAGLSFFTMNAYQTQLGGNTFVNVGVGGLIGGIPGNIMTIFLVRKFGKKKVIIIAHLLAALFSILIPIYDVGDSPYDWQRRLLGLLSLIAMSVAFPAVFLLSGELIPTVLRGSAMGVANLMARLGNTTAPLVGPTASINKWLPLCVVSGAPLISALVMFSIPDTGDGPLPNTIEDVERTNPRWQETVIISVEEGSKIYNPKTVIVHQDS